MKSAPLLTARERFDKEDLRPQALIPYPHAVLHEVAEDVATGLTMALDDKVRILLAIVRALSARRDRNIESIEDVTRLMLHDPDEFERLLHSYWLLLGTRGAA